MTPSAFASEPRTHDGLFVALSVGAQHLDTQTTDDDRSAPVELEATGLGTLGTFSVGGTPLPGLVVGGSILGAALPDAQQRSRYQELANQAYTVNLMGPLVDYFFHPQVALHVLFTVGLATQDSGNPADDLSVGAGFGIGAGYAFWVGSEVSLGFSGRYYLMKTADGSRTHQTSLSAFTFDLIYH